MKLQRLFVMDTPFYILNQKLNKKELGKISCTIYISESGTVALSK